MKIGDLFNMDDLQKEIDGGWIRVQEHPEWPYKIYNYTQKTVFERHWNPVTMNCRGLILHGERVVARSLAKFFNYDEHSLVTGEHFSTLDEVMCFDKIDGSLGIVYPTGDGTWAVATRGSFTSPQALHATQILQERYLGDTDLLNQLRGSGYYGEHDTTYLVEIVFPENRIVCDYKGMDDLVLLGAVNVVSGRFVPPELLAWSGPRAEKLPYSTLLEALRAPDRWGAEGMVLHFTSPLRYHAMVKIKQDEYVRLHRIVTGLSERAVWEWIKAGKSLDELCATVPEEFWPWIRKVGGDLIFKAIEICKEAAQHYLEAMAVVEDKMEVEFLTNPDSIPQDQAAADRMVRKYFAAEAAKSPHRPWLFMTFDRREESVVLSKILDTLRPVGSVTPFGSMGEEEE
jgi:RNA ligase